MSDFRVGRAEYRVGKRDLARVHATLADEAQIARELRFDAEAGFVLDVGECAVVCEDTGFARGERQHEHRPLHGGRFAARDAERLKQIGKPKLQPAHAFVRANIVGASRGFGRLINATSGCATAARSAELHSEAPTAAGMRVVARAASAGARRVRA